MKAWRYYGRRDLRLEEVSRPVPGEGEVLVKVLSCGICQTDVDEFMVGPRLFQPVPFIPGHEFGGVIAEVGPGVDKSRLGKTVTVAPLVACGEGKFCKIGRDNLCEQLGYYGIIRYNGGFAEYAVVKEENAIEVARPEIVHFGEILLVGLRAFSLAEKYAVSGKRALVSGGGPVGLAMALILRYYGWEVELCEIRDKRRAFASSLGIKTYSIIHEVPERNYSVVIDCAGEDPVIPYIFADQIAKITPGGALVLVGLYFSNVSLDALSIIKGEINIVPSFLYTKKEISRLPEVMEALAKPCQEMSYQVPFEGLIDALLEIETRKDDYIKLVLSHAGH